MFGFRGSIAPSLLAALLVTSPNVLGGATDEVVVGVRAYIDGTSRLILDDDTAQWYHLDFAAPGRLNCNRGASEEPTYLNGEPWFPVWPDVPDCENRNCGCTSDVVSGLAPVLPDEELPASLLLVECRGACTILEAPSAGNGYRVVLEFNDNPLVGGAWYEVELHLGGSVVRTCTSTVNSSGAAAKLYLLGGLSVEEDELTLEARGCPDGTFGLFFYGASGAQLPFGDGYLCVSPFAPGLHRLPPAVTTSLDGVAARPVDLDGLVGSGAITPGSTWYFQFWFRDLGAGGTGFNLSDALRVTFDP